MNSESKEYIYKTFLACANMSLDSEVNVAKSENLPEHLKQMPETLKISNAKCLTLIRSLHNLLKEYIHEGMQDEGVVAAKFPAEFKK